MRPVVYALNDPSILQSHSHNLGARKIRKRSTTDVFPDSRTSANRPAATNEQVSDPLTDFLRKTAVGGLFGGGIRSFHNSPGFKNQIQNEAESRIKKSSVGTL